MDKRAGYMWRSGCAAEPRVLLHVMACACAALLFALALGNAGVAWAADEAATEAHFVAGSIDQPDSSTHTDLSTASEAADFTYELSNDSAFITGYVGTGSVVDIPETIDGYTVIGVRTKSIADLETVEEISLPSTITTMADGSFTNLPNLKKLTVNGDLGYAKYSPKYWVYVRDCPNLEEIHLGPDVKHYGESKYRLQAQKYTVDPGNTAYYADALGILYSSSDDFIQACPTDLQLEELTLSNIAGIETYAFAYVDTLRNVAIDGAEDFELTTLVFYGCQALETLKFSNVAKTCSIYSVQECPAFETFEVEGTGSTRLQLATNQTISQTFETVIAGDGVRYIYGDWHSGSIQNLSLGKDAVYFGYASSREEEDPSQEIYYGVFAQIASISVDEDNPRFEVVDNALMSRDHTLLYGLPSNDGCLYYTVPDTVTVIRPRAFYRHQTLVEVVVPDSVMTIGDYAFNNYQMTRVRIPKSTTVIGSQILENDGNSSSIEGYSGSRAESYAKENGYAFIALDAPQEAIYADGNNYSVWDGNETTEVIPQKGTYVISTAAELAWLAQAVNTDAIDTAGVTVKLAGDIDLASYDWEPIGIPGHQFFGSFDGQGHIIRNITPSANYDTVGLFGCVVAKVSGQPTYVKDLVIKGFIGRNVGTCGGLAGTIGVRKGCELTVSGITVQGKISNCTNAGGIAAIGYCGRQDSKLTVDSCTSHVDIATVGGSGFSARSTGSGGILQQINYLTSSNGNPVGFGATIRKCKYRGALTGSGWYGGKAGIVQTINDNGVKGKTTISKCIAEGKITGVVYTNAAGILSGGGGKEILVYRCVNNMSVASGYDAGGVVASVGGNMTVRECANDGYVACNGTMTNCGGIAASNNGVIEDCLNIGEVAVRGYTGGIVGINHGVVQRCYDVGYVDKNAGAVARSGAITSYNTGKILHCYFDLQLVPSGKITEYESESGSSTDAVGYMTNVLKTQTPYKTWDFTDTTGVWTFHKKYCKGYPMIRGLIGLMKKHPEKEGHAKDEAAFTVVDQDGEPVELATIEYGTATGNTTETAQTDEAGEAIVKYHKDFVGARVNKDGYLGYEDDKFVVPSSQEYTFRIVDETKADEFTPMSAMLTYNNYRYELLTETIELNKKYVSETFTLQVKLFKDSANVDHYELVQPDAKQEVFATSADGFFSLAMGDLDVTQKRNVLGILQKRPIYVRVVDKSGGNHDTLINLDVTNKESMSSEMQFGKSVSFKVDADVPLFGGMEVQIPGYKLPFSLTVADDGSWEATLNFAEMDFLGKKHALQKKGKASLSDTFSWFGSMVDDELDPKKRADKAKDSYKALKNFFAKKDLPLTKRLDGIAPKSHGDITANVFGYASGDTLVPGKITTVTMKVYIVFEAKYDNEWQTVVFSIPTVVAFEIKGGFTVGGEWVLDDTVGLKSKRAILEPEASASLFGGVGFAYVGSVGLYLSGSIGGKAQVFTGTDEDGFYEAYGDLNFGAQLRIAGSEAASYTFWKGKKYFMNRDVSLDRLTTQAASDTDAVLGTHSLIQVMSEASEGALSTIERSSYGDISTTWSPKNATLYSNAYGDLSPRIMSVSGVPVMLMLADGDAGRPTNDKSMLMYSIYDSANKSWSQPAAVWDDGTADFQFDVVSDGSNGYVVWTNEKGAIADGLTYKEVLSDSEVAIARFDASAGAFVDAENITSNSDYEIQPEVAISNGQPAVSWTTNAANIFRFGGTSMLYIAQRNGSAWNANAAGSTSGTMLLSAFGILDGEPALAYVMDEGGNMSDAAQYKTYVATLAGGVTATQADEATNIRFANIGGQDKLLWTDAAGELFSIGAAADEPESTGTGFLGALKQVVRDDSTGNVSVLYTRGGDGNANGYACIYDAATATWSGEVALTSQTNFVEGLTGCYAGSELLTAFNCRTVNFDAEDYSGTNALMWNRAGVGSHVVASSASWDKYSAVAGATVPLSVTIANNGNKTAPTYHVLISDSEGEVYLDQTFNEPIAAGMTLSKSYDVTLPEQLTQRTLNVKVTDPANSTTYDDDTTSVPIGEDEIYLAATHYAIGGSHIVSISATNEGLGEAYGTIELYNVADDTVYDAYAFSELAKDDLVSYTVPLTMIDWTQSQDLQLGVRLANGDNVLGDHNRTLHITTKGNVAVQAVQLSAEELTLGEDNLTAQLSASALPDGATATGYEWWSLNEDIATVDQMGNVTAVSGGTTRIYVKETGSGKACSCKVTTTLPVNVDSVELSESSLRLAEYQSQQLTATVLPEEAAEDATVTWSSSDASVATVENGLVTALQEGNAVITAEAGGKQATCQVEVVDDPSIVKVEDLDDFQSNHPYEANADLRWIYHSPDADAQFLRVAFDEQTELEEGYDYLYIYDAQGNLLGRYTGEELAGASILVPGNAVTMRLTSDSSSQDFGFAISSLEALKTDDLPIQETFELDDEYYVGDVITTEDLLKRFKIPEDSQVNWENSNPDVAQVQNEGTILLAAEGTAELSTRVQFEVDGQMVEALHLSVTVTVKENPYEKTIVVTDPEEIGKNGDEDKINSWIYKDESAGHIALTFDDDLYFYWATIFQLDDDGEWSEMDEYSSGRLEGRTVLIPSSGVKVRAYGDAPVVKAELFEGDFTLDDFSISISKSSIYVDDEFTCSIDNITPSRYANMVLPIAWNHSDEVYKYYNSDEFCAEEITDEAWISATIGGLSRDLYFEVLPLPEWNDGGGGTAPSKVKVNKITLSGISNQIAAGKKISLTATVLPSNAANKGLTWTSSNTKVATVTNTGIVTIMKKTGGKSVIITATAKDGSGVKAMYKITSMKGAVKKIKLKGKASVKAGKSIKLKAKVKASKGANKKLRWISSNTKYAKVNSKGKVTAAKTAKGKKVKITCMATDGTNKKATKKIKIK